MFEHAQCGDIVLLRDRHTERLVRIERLTAQQAIVTGGQRFWRRTGYLVGGGAYDVASISVITPEQASAVRMKHKLAMLRKRIATTDWSLVPAETLTAIAELLAKDASAVRPTGEVPKGL